MILLAIVIFFGLKRASVGLCIIESPIGPSYCLECDSYSFYDFSIPFKGGEFNFLKTECKPRFGSKQIIEIYISSADDSEQSTQDGSASNPVKNLLQGFMIGWKQANQYLDVNLTFKLLGNGLEGEQENSYFFLNKADYPFPFQYLFRGLLGNIKIEPAYCNSSILFQKCIKNPQIKPKIYWRTENLYIFVTRSLTISKIILDARDQAFSAFINESNKNKIFCSEEELEEKSSSFGAKNAGQPDCKRLNIMLNSQNQPNGLFNIEQRMNLEGIIEKPLLKIDSTVIKNFLPLGVNYSIGCLVRMRRLAFSITIENSLFQKNYFSDGLFSTKVDCPPHLALIPFIYDSLSNDIENANNTFLMTNSVIFGCNYFQITESNPLSFEEFPVFLNIMTSTVLEIYFSQFINNTAPKIGSSVGRAFIYYQHMLRGPFFYEKTKFQGLVLADNNCQWFFRTKNVNFNDIPNGPLILADILFQRNINFGFFMESEGLGQVLLYVNSCSIINQTYDIFSSFF